MAETVSVKIPRTPSPVVRAGAGDISERELSRERHNMQSTPLTRRIQPAHPKKQLFSAPVSKFTGKPGKPSRSLARLKSCLDQYSQHATPARAIRVRPKAVSMEDLTPIKRTKVTKNKTLAVVQSPCPRTVDEQQAAARVARFMVVTAWRRRREDVRCLRKTLESQVTCSERLRIQVSTLKTLLDFDNTKLRLAIRELERLKQQLRDKDIEKAVLEQEKAALERDVCAAEDQASEMSVGWRNCRNELEGARASASLAEHALAMERAAAAEARAQRDHAYHRLSVAEEELSQHEALLSEAEQQVRELRRDADDRQRDLEHAHEQLRLEQEARACCSAQCQSLGARVAASEAQTARLRQSLAQLTQQLAAMDRRLADTARQLAWWPRPLTRMMGVARAWLERPLSLPEAAIWSLLPARHGC